MQIRRQSGPLHPRSVQGQFNVPSYILWNGPLACIVLAGQGLNTGTLAMNRRARLHRAYMAGDPQETEHARWQLTQVSGSYAISHLPRCALFYKWKSWKERSVLWPIL